jgi:hypothetical protein
VRRVRVESHSPGRRHRLSTARERSSQAGGRTGRVRWRIPLDGRTSHTRLYVRTQRKVPRGTKSTETNASMEGEAALRCFRPHRRGEVRSRRTNPLPSASTQRPPALLVTCEPVVWNNWQTGLRPTRS